MVNKYSIGFTGDISFSGYFKDAYAKPDLISPEVYEFFKETDANIINQESPITESKITKKKRLSHRTEPEAIDYINKMFNNPIYSIANNHMMDYRRIGMIDTLESLKLRNTRYIGGGKDIREASKYIILGDSVKIGVLAVQYKKFKIATECHTGTFHQSNEALLKKRIEEMKKKENVDWVVIVYHGGDEFLFSPMPYTRKLLRRYLSYGADVVVAHHPHVVQGYEDFGKKIIFYSLGNFIFDTEYQRVQEGTENGVLLRMDFDKDSFTYKEFPININREKQRIEKGTEIPSFIDYNKYKYGPIWTKEANRKLRVLENAKNLRINDNEKLNELSMKEYLRIEQLKIQCELNKAEIDMANDESYLDSEELDKIKINDDSTNNEAFEIDTNNESKFNTFGKEPKNKYSLKKIIKKILKMIGGKKTFVLRLGRIQYMFYYKHLKK